MNALRAGKFIGELLEGLRSIVYPKRCGGCERGLGEDSATSLCADCCSDVSWLHRPFCEVCGLPVDGRVAGIFFCPNCVGRRFAFDFAVAAARGRGVVREMIHGLKYGRKAHLAVPLAELMKFVLQERRLTMENALIVPVPLHPRRRRERGFNQAELIGREFGKHCGLPLVEALARVRYTTTQTQLQREERMQNLRHAFAMRSKVDVHGCIIWLVDDVMTTGSTAHACARVLKKAGAKRVFALAVARA